MKNFFAGFFETEEQSRSARETVLGERSNTLAISFIVALIFIPHKEGLIKYNKRLLFCQMYFIFNF